MLTCSQTEIKALSNCKIMSKIVREVRIKHDELGQNNTFTLTRLPGHSKVQCYEEPDILAKAKGESAITEPGRNIIMEKIIDQLIGLGTSTRTTTNKFPSTTLRGLNTKGSMNSVRISGFLRVFVDLEYWK